MNALSRIPFWGWYLFSVAFCYWLWNPYFSMSQMLVNDWDMSYKALMGVLTLIVAALYIVEGHRTLNVFGIILFIALFGCIFWIGSKSGLHNFDSVKWWGQWVVGLLLAIGIQGSRIWRNLFGTVTTITDDMDSHHHI